MQSDANANTYAIKNNAITQTITNAIRRINCNHKKITNANANKRRHKCLRLSALYLARVCICFTVNIVQAQAQASEGWPLHHLGIVGKLTASNAHACMVIHAPEPARRFSQRRSHALAMLVLTKRNAAPGNEINIVCVSVATHLCLWTSLEGSLQIPHLSCTIPNENTFVFCTTLKPLSIQKPKNTLPKTKNARRMSNNRHNNTTIILFII